MMREDFWRDDAGRTGRGDRSHASDHHRHRAGPLLTIARERVSHRTRIRGRGRGRVQLAGAEGQTAVM